MSDEPEFPDDFTLGDIIGATEEAEPLSDDEREGVVADLSDLEVYAGLLEPRGLRGLVVDCEDCNEPHYYSWELLQSNLRHLLDHGDTRVHEPAFQPVPEQYVSWEYARGYSDGFTDGVEEESSGS